MRCFLCIIFPPLLYPVSKILNLNWMTHSSISYLRHRITPLGKPSPLAVRLAEALPFRRAQRSEERRTLNAIAAKLIHYVFDIVCHTALRYKAISPHSRRTWYGTLSFPRTTRRSVGHSTGAA